jgi:hypothetical protein
MSATSVAVAIAATVATGMTPATAVSDELVQARTVPTTHLASRLTRLTTDRANTQQHSEGQAQDRIHNVPQGAIGEPLRVIRHDLQAAHGVSAKEIPWRLLAISVICPGKLYGLFGLRRL